MALWGRVGGVAWMHGRPEWHPARPAAPEARTAAPHSRRGRAVLPIATGRSEQNERGEERRGGKGRAQGGGERGEGRGERGDVRAHRGLRARGSWPPVLAASASTQQPAPAAVPYLAARGLPARPARPARPACPDLALPSGSSSSRPRFACTRALSLRRSLPATRTLLLLKRSVSSLPGSPPPPRSQPPAPRPVGEHDIKL
ncbi:hypothetical protein BDZ91DRAFT_762735 [Kalaharituber pfeilii]|nr:hypothetical protein BDZ91DRAFT_762735 [Kalaharituber pfeilii]